MDSRGTPTLITLTEPQSAAAEAYRSLRTNLMYGGAERGLTTVLVTSAANADEKSLVAANLAVVFAQAGHRTILVDADLRQPSQHGIWKADNAAGLSSMLQDDRAVSSPPLVQTSVPELHLLPAGPAPGVPSDLLGHPRMSEVIGVLKARSAYVVFDSPPVLAAADAALLGARVDGVLLVVQAGHTRRDQTARARDVLERVHVRLLGAVLTNAPRERTRPYGDSGSRGAR